MPRSRTLLAVVTGFVVATTVMMINEWLNGRVWYPELGAAAQGVTDREVVRQLLAAAPLGALLVVVFGWAIASVAGGYVAARIGRAAPTRCAMVLGLVLTLAGIANNLMLPPPAWFWVAGLVVFLPAAYVGATLATRR